jgi:hypothetical protein
VQRNVADPAWIGCISRAKIASQIGEIIVCVDRPLENADHPNSTPYSNLTTGDIGAMSNSAIMKRVRTQKVSHVEIAEDAE